MNHYHINVFWGDEDESWVADIPDLQHCSALGSTPQEALNEALEAKQAWLESARDHGRCQSQGTALLSTRCAEPSQSRFRMPVSVFLLRLTSCKRR